MLQYYNTAKDSAAPSTGDFGVYMCLNAFILSLETKVVDLTGYAVQEARDIEKAIMMTNSTVTTLIYFRDVHYGSRSMVAPCTR